MFFMTSGSSIVPSMMSSSIYISAKSVNDSTKSVFDWYDTVISVDVVVFVVVVIFVVATAVVVSSNPTGTLPISS